jgi:hypothetical protein
MPDKHTKGEMHGCIVCGRLHQLYVVYDTTGRFVDLSVMSAGGKRVADTRRPLVACDHHRQEQIEAAVERAYGPKSANED